MNYGIILALIGAVLLGASNGINGVEITLRNTILFLAGMSCLFVGGVLEGRVF